APFPGRNVIIIVTFGIILVTLALQGLTLAPVIRLLRLKVDDPLEHEELQRARLYASKAGLTRLNDLANEKRLTSDVVETLRQRYNHRIHVLENTDSKEATKDQKEADIYVSFRREIIKAERREIIRLRDADEIGDDTLRIIENDLDLEELLLSEDKRELQ
ncbi:MAG TPA: Na+/H+ antiporter, partial [Blastocatellia bacterium]|nr:Na+/H+ antiporter [Blastocatellia bacterium]